MKINPPKAIIGKEDSFEHALFGRKEFAESLKEIITGASEIGSDVIEKKIENYGVEKDALKKFKESLAKLAAKVREKQKFPLTIIVDELDRCRPDFALGLLERIKHLFDVQGVAFVLLVNRSQIESYIKTVYGNADAEAYLLKFGNLFVDLPRQERSFSVHYQAGRKEFCHNLYNHFEFSTRVQDGGFLITCISNWVSRNRRSAIPQLCSRLDRFSLLPK